MSGGKKALAATLVVQLLKICGSETQAIRLRLFVPQSSLPTVVLHAASDIIKTSYVPARGFVLPQLEMEKAFVR